MTFESYENTKKERVENGIKITRYAPSEKNGYRALRNGYSKSRKSIKNPAVEITVIGI